MTRDELRGIVEGITDEQLKAVLDINSRDIGKTKGDLKTVKAKLEELEKDIAARKEADEKAALENSFKERFAAVCGEAEFLNEFTKNGIFTELKTALPDFLFNLFVYNIKNLC